MSQEHRIGFEWNPSLQQVYRKRIPKPVSVPLYPGKLKHLGQTPLPIGHRGFCEAVPRPEEIFSARVQLFQFFHDLFRQRQPDRLPRLLCVEQQLILWSLSLESVAASLIRRPE